MTTNLRTVNRLEVVDYVLIALIMGLMGSFFWAIRGTTGFGGTTGGTLAGLGWGMLWLGFSRFVGGAEYQPYGSGRMIAAITAGIAVGGMTGYGVYIAWLNGDYYLNYPKDPRPIAAWTGYAMLFVCGIHWGGITGAFMAWCAPLKALNHQAWIWRILSGIAGACTALVFVRIFPQLFLPFYSEGIYNVAEYKTAQRALGSIQNIAPHVGLYLGFLSFEVARKDWRAVKLMLLMALGFAIPFTLGGYWQTQHGSELRIDWWKNWEMTIGLGGGLTFGLAFYLFNQPDAKMAPRPVTRLERIFGVGLSLWIGINTVILGAYEGYIRLHELKDSLEATRGTAFVLANGIALLLFAAWVYRTLKMEQKKLYHPDSSPMAMRLLPGILGLIVVAGFIVSTPPQMQLAQHVLLVLYTVYVGGSILLFGLLWKRCGGI